MQLVFQNHCMCFSERKQKLYTATSCQDRIWNFNPIHFLWLTSQVSYIINLPYFFRGWEIGLLFSKNLEILGVGRRMRLEGSIGNGAIEKPGPRDLTHHSSRFLRIYLWEYSPSHADETELLMDTAKYMLSGNSLYNLPPNPAPPTQLQLPMLLPCEVFFSCYDQGHIKTCACKLTGSIDIFMNVIKYFLRQG